MVQRQRTPSHQPEPQAEKVTEDFSTAHPLLHRSSQVDKFIEAAAKRKEAKEFQIEELDKWKDVVNGLAGSPNGRIFLQSMIKFSGLFEPANIRDTMGMVDVGVKSAFYLKWVRPHLNPELRSTIE